MKKYLFILATAAIVASCSSNDTFKGINSQEENGGEAIHFASFTGKQTKAENSNKPYSWAFYEYQPDFLVWGYKDDATDPVFKGDATNDKVSAARSGQGTNADPYVYTFGNTALLRYWDKSPSRSYQFYAAAPATLPNSESWTFTAPTNADKSNGYFTTTSTLTGVNLQATSPSSTLIYTFKNLADCDKLIAAPCAGNYVTFSAAVQLHFIHILGKLNVTVRKDATALPDDKYEVKLNKIEINGLYSTGTFTEGATAYAYAATGSNSRWSSRDGSVAYKFENNSGVTLIESTSATDRVYFIESLVIPQTVATTQVIAYDGRILDGSYADVDAYNTGHGLTGGAALTADQFAALPDAAKVKPAVYTSVEEYNTAKGSSLASLDGLTLEQKAKYVYETGSGAAPYFVLQYTIKYNGNTNAETFTSYHNLASSFTGNSLAFYEGYQNTININILPDAIEFTADVAEWDDMAADPNPVQVD